MRKPLLLAAAVALALSGCASNSTSPAGAASATADVTTVTASEVPTETPTPTPTQTPTPTPTPTAEPAKLTYECAVNGTFRDFTNFRDVWATKAAVNNCQANFVLGSKDLPLTPTEQKAVTTAYGETGTPDQIRELYAICGETSGIPIEFANNGEQAKEAEGAILLCPDHPKMGLIKESIASGLAKDKANAAIESERESGKFLDEGSYLVGKEAVPGTWQSQGERVTNCYWEISDRTGNIMANNFISIAPQFTIKVPVSAAGLTIRGCSFRWIGP